MLKTISKMRILTVFNFIGILFLMLMSCGNGDKTTRSRALIQGKVEVQHPYCGGYKPPESKSFWSDTLPNTKFIAFKDSLNSKQKFTFQTDEKGEFTVELPVGNYKIFYAEKINYSNDFLKKRTRTGGFYSEPDDECLLNWIKTPEFTLAVEKNETINLRLKYNCEVKDNPCIRYIGPPRP